METRGSCKYDQIKSQKLFAWHNILTMIVCSIGTWHMDQIKNFFPETSFWPWSFVQLAPGTSFSQPLPPSLGCVSKENQFSRLVDSSGDCEGILKVHCLMSNRCKDKIWMLETLNNKEDKDEDELVRDIESQSHLHGITLTTPAGTPAFSQIAAFDQIMRTL